MRTIYHSILIYLLISQLLFIIIWNSTSNHVTKLSNNLSTIACNTDPLYSMPTACEGGAQLFASSLQQKSMPLQPKYGPYRENYAVSDKNLSLRGRRQISRPKHCPRDKSLSPCSQYLLKEKVLAPCDRNNVLAAKATAILSPRQFQMKLRWNRPRPNCHRHHRSSRHLCSCCHLPRPVSSFRRRWTTTIQQ